MVSDDILELRGVDDPDDATLEDVWIAGQPVGIILERQRDRIDELERKLEAVEDTAVQADQKASTAMGAAKATDDGVRADGAPAKVDAARFAARDYLVKNALTSRTQSVTLSKITELVEPEHDIAYQTAKDAADDLAHRWRGIGKRPNEAGNKALHAVPAEFEKDLVAVVEESLGRDDLTKELISRREEVGGS
jgi:hypothetical protein